MSDLVKLTESGAWAKYRKALPNVEGWLHPFTAEVMHFLSLQQTKMGITGNVAEIGVHHGKSFLPLYLALGPDEIAIAIDVFEDQAYNLDASGRGSRAAFLKNVQEFAPGCTSLRIVQKNSLDVLPHELTAFGSALRTVSIDGSHTEAATVSDLKLSQAAARDDGLIYLDDVYNEHWPEVVSGFALYLQQATYSPLAIVPGKVVLCGTPYAPMYRSVLQVQFGPWIDYEKHVFGSPCLGLGLNGSFARRRFAMTPTGRALKQFKQAFTGKLNLSWNG